MMERIFLVVLAGTLGGFFAGKMNLPGGPIVGAMLGTALTAVLIPGSFVIPDNLSTGIQIVLGITLGMAFDRSSLELVPQIMPLAILSTIVLLLISVLLAYGAGRFGVIDFSTALFGLAPGGMSGMSLMAQSEGYRTDVVAMLHTVRIFTLFLIVPLLGRILQILFR